LTKNQACQYGTRGVSIFAVMEMPSPKDWPAIVADGPGAVGGRLVFETHARGALVHVSPQTMEDRCYESLVDTNPQ
jgi:hypothetical protein